MSGERTLLVDASVFITLADIGATELLFDWPGQVVIPKQVEREISTEPAASTLADGLTQERAVIGTPNNTQLVEAARHLGRDVLDEDPEERDRSAVEGDVALLALALDVDGTLSDEFGSVDAVVVSDDKPLRQTCKALSIPVSGSIGVLIRAVERGDLDADEAKAKLEAMDEVGARLSASLYRKAERMIDEAADE